MTSPRPLAHGRYYHIYNRGTNREDLLLEERNYRYFLQLYAKYIEPVAQTYAYCLLRNHFHLLVWIMTQEQQRTYHRAQAETTKLLSPSQQFGNLFNAYAKAINKAYGRTGSLFQHPFGRVPVTSDEQLVHLVTYIHHNPQKHGLVDDFRRWPWSSYSALAFHKPTRVQRDEVMGWFQGLAGFETYHQQGVSERAVAALVPEDFDG
jgi:putative transposase